MWIYSVFILCCSYYIRSINFYQVFFVVYFNGFLLVPAFIINFTLFINSVYLKDACRWNTKINSPKFFYSLAPSFLLNLGQGVSSHCKGLQSHLCDYKPSQLPTRCYLVCVLHGNHVFSLVFRLHRKRWVRMIQDLHLWRFWESERCPYILALYTAPTQSVFVQFALFSIQNHLRHWKSLFYSLLHLVNFFSLTSCFRSLTNFSISSSFSLWYLTSSIIPCLFILSICFHFDGLLEVWVGILTFPISNLTQAVCFEKFSRAQNICLVYSKAMYQKFSRWDR